MKSQVSWFWVYVVLFIATLMFFTIMFIQNQLLFSEEYLNLTMIAGLASSLLAIVIAVSADLLSSQFRWKSPARIVFFVECLWLLSGILHIVSKAM